MYSYSVQLKNIHVRPPYSTSIWKQWCYPQWMTKLAREKIVERMMTRRLKVYDVECILSIEWYHG